MKKSNLFLALISSAFISHGYTASAADTDGQEFVPLPTIIHCSTPVSQLPNQPTLVEMQIDPNQKVLDYTLYDDMGVILSTQSNFYAGTESEQQPALTYVTRQLMQQTNFPYSKNQLLITASISGYYQGKCPSRLCGTVFPYKKQIELLFKRPVLQGLPYELHGLMVNGEEKVGKTMSCLFVYGK